MARSISSLAAVAGLLYATLAPAAATDWPLFGYDSARSSFNSAEHTLTIRNVHRLHERWQTALGAVADSTPILLERVRVGHAYIPMLYQTTKNGVTLGIDATTGKILWHFTTHGSTITDSTPAADPSGKAIYVPGIDGKVHKVSAGRGHELHAPGFPARITKLPLTEKDASPLNVANGYLYAVTSGYYGDAPPYDGHVVAVNLSTGKTTVFNSLCAKDRKLPTQSSCSQERSGIWGRGGAVVDPDSSLNGRVYAATGNGQFDAGSGGDNYGDSLLSLSTDLSSFLGSYTPTNYQQLEDGDTDLGSSSPGMLPTQSSSNTPDMLVEGGKDAILKLLNRASLPGIGGELQEVNLPGGLFSAPAVWTDSSNNAWVFMGFSNEVEAYRLQTSSSGVSTLNGIWQVSPGNSYGEGSSPVAANGMVFSAFDGALVALNAVSGKELWSSAMHSSGVNIGSIHWESPIVVNGWIYCSDESGNLTAYSL
ncbi:MAG TPA: PQQ-binding-like beta-propeller repeat protein [Candidatus Cybelea sp.]|jgi:outer membrane protein assembly factor BamB|nr:PQQ-binding-like beta-propeller repeat protein [Candidatus Cybelea sp.]